MAHVVGAEKMTATRTADVGDIFLGAKLNARRKLDIDAGFAGLFARNAQNKNPAITGDRSEELAMNAAKYHGKGMEPRMEWGESLWPKWRKDRCFGFKDSS